MEDNFQTFIDAKLRILDKVKESLEEIDDTHLYFKEYNDHLRDYYKNADPNSPYLLNIVASKAHQLKDQVRVFACESPASFLDLDDLENSSDDSIEDQAFAGEVASFLSEGRKELIPVIAPESESVTLNDKRIAWLPKEVWSIFTVSEGLIDITYVPPIKGKSSSKLVGRFFNSKRICYIVVIDLDALAASMLSKTVIH